VDSSKVGALAVRVAGAGVLGLAGLIGGSLLSSQTAFAAGTSSGHPLAAHFACTDGHPTTGTGSPGSAANPLSNRVTVCGSTKNTHTSYPNQPIKVVFWQIYSGHGRQETQINGYFVLDVEQVENGVSGTTSVYVPVATVLGKGKENSDTVHLSIPKTSKYSEVVGGYFHGYVTSNTEPVEFFYDVSGLMGKLGTSCDEFSLKGHAWIDPTPLGTPIAPLFGSEGMEVVGLVGIASAGLVAATVIKRRQIALS
jgi:hypothetical protein